MWSGRGGRWDVLVDLLTIRVLVTISPGEFEAFFLDPVELMKRVTREHPDFQRLYLDIVRKHSKWLRPSRLDASITESIMQTPPSPTVRPRKSSRDME